MTIFRTNKPKHSSNLFRTKLLFAKNNPRGEKKTIMSNKSKPASRIEILFFNLITNPNLPFVLEFVKTCYDFVGLAFPELPNYP